MRRFKSNLPMPTLRAPMLALLKRICGRGVFLFSMKTYPCPHCGSTHAVRYNGIDPDVGRNRVYSAWECFLCGATVLGPDLFAGGWT